MSRPVLFLLLVLAVESSFGAIFKIPHKPGYVVKCVDNDELEERCFATGSSPIKKEELFEGDILVQEKELGLRNAIIDKSHHWPNATVPYVFHESFTEGDKKLIREALRGIEAKTCVRFVPWTPGGGFYALITNEKGCHATLGYSPKGRKHARVNVHDTSCLKRPGTIQHEFLHLLGLKHEQSRPDRDKYVRVLWSNIIPEHRKNFRKASPKRFTTFGLPYDYKSVMHYGRLEFTSDGKPTLVAKIDETMELGQRKHATELDLEKIRRMYCN